MGYRSSRFADSYATRSDSYEAYNIPVYGNLRRAQESKRYVADIQKNTGRTVKYPGLVYNMAGLAGIREGAGLSKGLGQTSRWM